MLRQTEFILVTLFLAMCTLWTSSLARSVRVQHYRFAAHRMEDFERFIIDFVADKNGSAPDIRLVETPESKEAMIQVPNVGLTSHGAVSQVAVNEQLRKISKNFDSVIVGSESAGKGFVVRIMKKESKQGVSAIWMESPLRLVVDVHGEKSKKMIARNRLASSPKNTVHLTMVETTRPASKIPNDYAIEIAMDEAFEEIVANALRNDELCPKGGLQAGKYFCRVTQLSSGKKKTRQFEVKAAK